LFCFVFPFFPFLFPAWAFCRAVREWADTDQLGGAFRRAETRHQAPGRSSPRARSWRKRPAENGTPPRKSGGWGWTRTAISRRTFAQRSHRGRSFITPPATCMFSTLATGGGARTSSHCQPDAALGIGLQLTQGPTDLFFRPRSFDAYSYRSVRLVMPRQPHGVTANPNLTRFLDFRTSHTRLPHCRTCVRARARVCVCVCVCVCGGGFVLGTVRTGGTATRRRVVPNTSRRSCT
jgi:hypothetical protein